MRHGTRTGYTQGCRQECCRRAALQVQAHRTRMLAYGRPTTDLVDAEPVREHVQALREAGVSLDTVADHSGVSTAVLQRLVYGNPANNRPPTQRMRPNNAEAILAVRADLHTLPEYALVDPSGTRRRALSLAWMGHSLSWQAAQCGYRTHEAFTHALRSERVRAGLARRMRVLFEEYWDRPATGPTALWVHRRAERQGAVPPAGWDEEFLDLPEEELEVELARRVALMESADLYRAYEATKEGERSPLIVAAARECLRLRAEDNRRRRAKKSISAAA